jgi:hydroxymethylglutaryl-CoA reductase
VKLRYIHARRKDILSIDDANELKKVTDDLLEMISAVPETSLIVEKLHQGFIKFHALEMELKLDFEAAAIARRTFVLKELSSASPVPCTSPLVSLPVFHQGRFYEDVYQRCCENVIGYTTIPTGITTKFVINGEPFFIPLSTCEGALVASISRGGRATADCGV